ncbi:hypothetical protein [Nocardioides sp. T2.26MG-1]|uniref:hypothetical protein n=1 Tax=Nocardioides sp. T2.26MG-1 TaxID=3041166 RepID=UPI002477813D|nr:hypothetical protein [Nocardioides sp. T2.26MG-1]CAI9416557.1 hypothetical protein HIDPHFAB_02802 [Nocardioides sp. T2.26MG-1]
MIVDPRFVGRDARDAVGVQLLVLVSAVAGLALVVAGVRIGGWGAVLGGGLLLTSAAHLRLSMFGRRRPGKRLRETWGPDGVELRVGLRPHRPLGLLCAALSLVMMFGTALFLVESSAGRVLLWVILPLPLLLVPDCVRGLLAGGREVILTPRALTYRGWSYDIEVPWEDIAYVGVDGLNPWVPSIRFDLRPTTTARAVRHKMVAWLDPKPQPDNFQIPVLAVDVPRQLQTLAGLLADMGPSDRSRFLARDGLTSLTSALRR